MRSGAFLGVIISIPTNQITDMVTHNYSIVIISVHWVTNRIIFIGRGQQRFTWIVNKLHEGLLNVYLWIFRLYSPLVVVLVVEHYTFVSQLFEQEQGFDDRIASTVRTFPFPSALWKSSGTNPKQHDDEEICKIILGSEIRGIIKWFSSCERISSRRPNSSVFFFLRRR